MHEYCFISMPCCYGNIPCCYGNVACCYGNIPCCYGNVACCYGNIPCCYGNAAYCYGRFEYNPFSSATTLSSWCSIEIIPIILNAVITESCNVVGYLVSLNNDEFRTLSSHMPVQLSEPQSSF